MSGHSHWSSIKHKKVIEDQKRGKIFSKLARLISVAAREGSDPEMNPKLRKALQEARSFNMPKDKIEKAIKRGIGEIEGEKLYQFSYEGVIPGKISLIIEGITDNKNRTLSEIKQILQKYQGKLAIEGSLKWQFEKKGVLTLNLKNQFSQNFSLEGLQLKVIEAGAEDIYLHPDKDLLDVYAKPEELEKVKKNLENQGFKIESFSLHWVAKEQVELSPEERKKYQKLFEELGENEAVQDIYSNFKN